MQFLLNRIFQILIYNNNTFLLLLYKINHLNKILQDCVVCASKLYQFMFNRVAMFNQLLAYRFSLSAYVNHTLLAIAKWD